jgi:hypothetical protein
MSVLQEQKEQNHNIENTRFWNNLYEILDMALTNWDLTHQNPDADYWVLPVPGLEKRTRIIGRSSDGEKEWEGCMRLDEGQIISRILVDDTNEVLYGTWIGRIFDFDGINAALYFGSDRKVYYEDLVSDPIPLDWEGMKVTPVYGGYDLRKFGKDYVFDP